MCGLEYDLKKAEAACEAACPLWKKCDLVRCPNCFYETVLEPAWFRRLFAPPCSLADLPPGRQAQVSRIETDDRDALRKIIAMGVLPETKILLVQKFPGIVFEIGSARFSVDEELARRIHVRENP
ncbi:MAG: ferrous iron transport protein A [Candidatus Omnitrophica bacterium]|nr:ferrous iron transport protein A [Candidatus Omnitrophota bacterium]